MISLHCESEQNAATLKPIQLDRRAHPRFFLQGTAVIRILPQGLDVLGAVIDMSIGGCGVEVGFAIPAQVGATVDVDLHVRGVSLRRSGIIRRIDLIRSMEKETRVGIEFVELSRRRAQGSNTEMHSE